MKRGILGGSFNPPHKIHLKIAQELVKHKVVDKVMFIPNIYNPLGKRSIDPNHRLEMLRLMTHNKQGLEVSDLELTKEHQNYTYQTMDELQKMYPDDEIIPIIGSDILGELKNWKEYHYLLTHYKIIVYKRDKDNIQALINNHLKDYQNNIIIYDQVIGSNLSSSYIRDLLLNNKKASKYIEANVYKYIKENNLYHLIID